MRRADRRRRSSCRPWPSRCRRYSGRPSNRCLRLRCRDGAAWLVTYGDGIMRIANPDRFQGGRISEKDPLVEKYSGKDGLSDGDVFCLLEDREGNVWVGTAAGLDRFRNRNLGWTELQSGLFQGFKRVAAGEEYALV